MSTPLHGHSESGKPAESCSLHGAEFLEPRGEQWTCAECERLRLNRRVMRIRRDVERRMSCRNGRASRFSDSDRVAVESVLVDVIREAEAS